MTSVSKTSPLLLDVRCYGEQNQVHTHDYHQLVLPVSGALELEIEGQYGQVNATHAAVITAGNRHVFSALQDNQFIVADVPVAWANMLDTLPPYLELSPALRSYIDFVAIRIQQSPQSIRTDEQILMLLLELMTEQLQSAPQIDKRVSLARLFLDEHIAEQVSLSQVAIAAHLSVRQLSDLFKLQLGLSPIQYLRQKRMAHAMWLLTHSNESIQWVAESVGYQSLSAFSDRFQKHFGNSPSHFRPYDKK